MQHASHAEHLEGGPSAARRPAHPQGPAADGLAAVHSSPGLEGHGHAAAGLSQGVHALPPAPRIVVRPWFPCNLVDALVTKALSMSMLQALPLDSFKAVCQCSLQEPLDCAMDDAALLNAAHNSSVLQVPNVPTMHHEPQQVTPTKILRREPHADAFQPSSSAAQVTAAATELDAHAHYQTTSDPPVHHPPGGTAPPHGRFSQQQAGTVQRTEGQPAQAAQQLSAAPQQSAAPLKFGQLSPSQVPQQAAFHGLPLPRHPSASQHVPHHILHRPSHAASPHTHAGLAPVPSQAHPQINTAAPDAQEVPLQEQLASSAGAQAGRATDDQPPAADAESSQQQQSTYMRQLADRRRAEKQHKVMQASLHLSVVPATSAEQCCNLAFTWLFIMAPCKIHLGGRAARQFFIVM